MLHGPLFNEVMITMSNFLFSLSFLHCSQVTLYFATMQCWIEKIMSKPADFESKVHN